MIMRALAAQPLGTLEVLGHVVPTVVPCGKDAQAK